MRNRNDGTLAAIKVQALCQSAKKTFFLEKWVLLRDALPEFELMRRAEHPNIVNVHDYDRDQSMGVLWAIIDLCLGGELVKRLSAQQVSERGAISEANQSRWLHHCLDALAVSSVAMGVGVLVLVEAPSRPPPAHRTVANVSTPNKTASSRCLHHASRYQN